MMAAPKDKESLGQELHYTAIFTANQVAVIEAQASDFARTSTLPETRVNLLLDRALQNWLTSMETDDLAVQ